MLNVESYIDPIRINFDYEIIGRSVKITFRNSTDRSTILGGSGPIVMLTTEHRISKLPHDLVHASLSSRSEGRTLDGLTPDIVHTNAYIEIVTRNTHRLDIIERAMQDKLMKYNRLKVPGIIIGVGVTEVICTHGELPDQVVGWVQEVYLKGLRVLSDYYRLNGRLQDLDEVSLPAFDHKRWENIEPEFKYQSPSVKYVIPYNYQSNRKTPSPVTHLPMITLEPTNDPYTLCRHNPLESFISECIYKHQPEMQRTYKELEFLHCFAPGKAPLKKTDTGSTSGRVKVDIPMELKVMFALRGVNATSMRDHPDIQAKVTKSKEPYSPDVWTGDIDSYLNTPIRLSSIDSFTLADRHGSWEIDPMTDILRWSRFEEYWSLKLLDRILYEVALNCHRHCKSGEFIVKKLLDAPAYVIMKPTRYSGVDNPPCHVMVVYRGRPLDPVFQDPIPLSNGWKCHNWFSVDRQKLSHLRNCQYQFMTMLATLKEISVPEIVSKTLLLHFLVEDRSTTTFLQALRYYYMSLYSGVHKDDSLKVCSKFPLLIRSRLNAYFYQKWRSIHSRLPDRVNYSTEELEDDFDHHKVNYSMQEVETPMGFSIRDSSTFLLACYFGYCVNKDKGEMGHDSKAILTKMMTKEYLYRDTMPELDVSSPSLEFQFNSGFVKRGCDFFVLRCPFIRSSILNSLKTSLSDCLSTKSSCTETTLKMPDDMKHYDRRSKVFLELSRIDISSHRLIESVGEIIELAREKPCVSLFRKNQIGGLREIFILSMPFRLACRVVEDISRFFCGLHESEMLTKDAVKGNFSSQHSSKVHQMKSLYKTTFRWSGDMSSWAPHLLVDYFKCMFSNILPPDCQDIYGVICEILEIHKTKRLYLPRSALKSFELHSELSEESVQRLRDEIQNEKKPYFRMHTNMMQGILHFTSSLYHILLMECFCDLLRKHYHDYEIATSFQISSDDEGMMITLGSDSRDSLIDLSKSFRSTFIRLKHSCDMMFGVRTSWEKSTLTNREIYEFNSKFIFGNELSTPILKFTLRSLYDHPSENLHTRISSLYSQLQEVRAQGGSGYLCSTLEHLQNFSMRANLGSMCTWWAGFLESFEQKCFLSYLGRHWVSPPSISGFASSQYHDYRVCKMDDSSRQLYSSIGVRSSLYFHDALDVVQKFTLFPRRLYQKALKRYEIPEHIDLPREDWSLLLRKRATSMPEFKLLLSIYAGNPGIAKSFAPLTRSDVTRASVYLAYTPIFGHKGSRTHSILGALDLRGSEVELEKLFPSHSDFERLEYLANSILVPTKYDVRPSFKQHKVYPFGPSDDMVNRWRECLLQIWFGEDLENGDTNEIVFERLQSIFSWMTRDPSETLTQSPFESFQELISFLETWSRGVKVKTILMIGRGGGIADLTHIIPLNTLRGHRVLIQEDHDLPQRVQKDYEFESRVSSWEVLLSHSDSKDKDEVIKMAEDDIRVLSSSPSYQLSNVKQSLINRSSFELSILALSGKISYKEFVELYPAKLLVYMQPQDYIGGEFVGEGRMLLKKSGSLCEVTLSGNTVLSYMTKEGIFWKKNLSREHLILTPSSRHIPSYPALNDTITGMFYQRGLRLRVNSIGYTQVFSSPSQVGFNRYPYPGNRILEKWLQQSPLTPKEVGVVISSNDSVSRCMHQCIKKCLQNTTVTYVRERAERDEGMNDIDEEIDRIFDDLEEFQGMIDDPDPLRDEFDDALIFDFTNLSPRKIDEPQLSTFTHATLRIMVQTIKSSVPDQRIMNLFGEELGLLDDDFDSL